MTRGQAAAAAAVWLVLSVGLWAVGTRPAVVVLAGIVAAAATGLVLLARLVDDVLPIEWHHDPEGPGAVARTERCLLPLRNQLDLARRYQAPDLHLTLVELIDERLQAHHRVDRAGDPAAAGAVLTPTLARLVGGPPRPLTSARELRQILTDIEAL